jgi:hypothetical protein
MKYLEKVTNDLISGIKDSLKEENINHKEAEHLAALLIQIFLYNEDGFVPEIEYVKMALKAIRRENGRHILREEESSANEKGR